MVRVGWTCRSLLTDPSQEVRDARFDAPRQMTRAWEPASVRHLGPFHATELEPEVTV